MLLLSLVLLLSSCGARFDRGENGQGYTDSKTDIYYAALPATYEAYARGEQIGEYVDKEHDRTVPFYVIPDMDAARFLTDDYGTVYCADEVLPDAQSWEVKSILVCEEDAVSVVMQILDESEVLAKVQNAWFEGEQTELPKEQYTFTRRLKLTCDAYKGVYYCFRFYVFENKEAYFYELESGRTVACPVELVEILSAK